MATPLDATIYVGPTDYVGELIAELGSDAHVLAPGSRLVLAPGPPRPASWAHDIWLAPQRIEVASISKAAQALAALGRNWVLEPTAHHRRAALIAEQLPHFAPRPIVFPSPLPTAPLGTWTLVERDQMIASARCASPFPHGEPQFVENKVDPPSRAYLKLWEALTHAGRLPARGQRCVDLGASPGGWTWVLATLGAHVTSVDKAPIDDRLLALPNVAYRGESAFGLDPRVLAPVDWMVSDIICYPERMLGLLERWLAVYPDASYVCTIKFKGDVDRTSAPLRGAARPRNAGACDFAPLRALVAAHGGTLRHLFHGKHELTWTRLAG